MNQIPPPMPSASNSGPRGGSSATAEPVSKRQFPCVQCGANVEFAPGQGTLQCPYCQTENEIAAEAEPVVELDYRAVLAELCRSESMQETLNVRCGGCGAEAALDANVTARTCCFCGSPIVAQAISISTIKPRLLLPFNVSKKDADELFRKWLISLWFAPNDLKRFAARDTGLNGIYVPYWTYDTDTDSYYRGQRGDDYWTTETYTTTENGKRVTRTRQVKRTRWRSVSGRVRVDFDDILVLASTSLPRKYADRLEPWDLNNLTAFNEAYLAGFVAESYHVDLESGFEQARQIMDSPIRQAICRDIGGDHQRIHSVQTRYDNITFKHILLPIWMSTYRYRNQPFRFLVNARTGQVQGERPWSAAKIILLIMTILAVVASIALLYTYSA